MNRKYIPPRVFVVDVKMTQEMLTVSEISVIKNEETFTSDVQLSRGLSGSIWDEENDW